MARRAVEVDVHRTHEGYWAQVKDIEGCFATGKTLDELFTALTEALCMYQSEHEQSEHQPARLHTQVTGLRIAIEPDARPSGEIATTRPQTRRRWSHVDDALPPHRHKPHESE